MANIIKIKRGPGKPQLSDLSEGEFGVDLTNEVLYYRKDSQLIILGKSFLYELESDDIRIREQNALKFGGIETNDAAFEIRYKEETESLVQ